MALVWHGDRVERKAQQATVAAMEETTAACIDLAKATVNVDTSTLQGSIQSRPVQRDSRGFVQRWGSFDVNYAIYQEVLPEPRGKAYLRPSADTEYPKLAARIRRNMQR